MKKILFLIFVFLAIISCRQENKEKEISNVEDGIVLEGEYKALTEGIALILEKEISRKEFKDRILPLTKKLLLEDPKYKMVNLIAEKISKETNKEAFKLNLDNFKKEFQKQLNQ